MGLSSCSKGVPTVALVLLFLSSTVLCDCPTPTLPRSSRLRSSDDLKDSYPTGTVLRLVCIPGYEFVPGTRPLLTCSADDTWSALPELCQGKRCPVPHFDNGRIVVSEDLRFGETVTLGCNHGFRMIGESVLRCILRGGEVRWHRDVPFCEQIPCVRPTRTPNGRFEADLRDTYLVGTTVLYRCDPSYSLIGNSTITCVVTADGLNGEWSSPPPECKKVSCAKPRIPNGGLASISKPSYTYGDSVTLECDPGYALVGGSLVRCDADNTWKPSLPRCVRAAATTKPTRPPTRAPPVPPIVPPIVPPPPPVPPLIPPVPPEVDETTFIPMYPTQREPIPTVDSGPGPASGSGAGKMVGIILGLIVGLLALAALIYAALWWRRKRGENAPDPSQAASEKEKTMGDRTTQKKRSKTSGSIQHLSALELKPGAL